MNILRKIGVTLSAALLSTALFSVAWSSVALSTIHNRETVKRWLDETKAYSRVVDIVLEQVKTSEDSGNESLPIDDAQVKSIAKTALSPEFLKEKVESVLDSVYSWLDGTSPTLSFSVDLAEAKQKLAVGLGDYVETRVATLPVCATKSTASFDPFTAICRPKTLSAEQAGKDTANKILTSKDFFQDTVLSSEDIKVKDDSGKEIDINSTQQAKVVRNVYQIAGMAPMVFGVLALLGALGVIFISRDRLAGVRRVGVVLLTVGVFVLLAHLVIGSGIELADKKINETAEYSTTEKALFGDLVKVILGDLRSVLVKYAAGYLVVGTVAVVGAVVLRKRRGGGNDKKSGHEDAPKDTMPDEPSKSETLEAPKAPENHKLETKVPVKKIDM